MTFYQFPRSFTALLPTKNIELSFSPDPLPILHRTIQMVFAFLPTLYPLSTYSLPITIPIKNPNWSISPSLHLAFTQPSTQEKQKTGRNTGQQHFGMISILRNQDQRF